MRLKRPALRFLSGRDVVQALPMKDAVKAMKDAFIRLSQGEAEVPKRIHIEASAGGGDALIMPSYLPGEHRLGVKVVTLFEDNRKRGLPLIQALMVVLDGATGSPLAVMDAASLTAIRTGAASGAATDLLARKSAREAAVFGAGVQARTQLEAVCTVRSIARARVFDRDGSLAKTFAQEMSKRLNLPVDAAKSPAAALARADVVCTATTSRTPVFDDRDLAPGVHINAVGAYRPEVREVPGETVARARVVVDHLPAALEEAGDLLIPMKEGRIDETHIQLELGEIAAGQKSGRTDEEEITLFKSVGVAVQDLSAAVRLLTNAERMGLGTELAL